MAYTLEIADAVSNTIGKFVTLNGYQLAGHVANLDFWMRQVKHALEVIDGYSARHRSFEQAQKEYISAHDTRRFFPESLEMQREFPGDPCYKSIAAKPDRYQVPAETLNQKRREIVNSSYRFLLRCHNEGLLSKTAAKKALTECGIGIEPGDFRD